MFFECDVAIFMILIVFVIVFVCVMMDLQIRLVEVFLSKAILEPPWSQLFRLGRMLHI